MTGSGPGTTSDGGVNPMLLVLALVGGGGLLLLAARRRSRRHSDDASGEGAPAGSPTVGPGGATPAVLAEMTPVDDELAPVDEDAPLRQSRKAVRKAPPVVATGAAAAAKRTFDKPPSRGVARAKVGYRQVRISSEPDAVRSVELGRLDRGDEIEIVDSHEGFLQIRTPDDITGWILRHTIVGAPST